MLSYQLIWEIFNFSLVPARTYWDSSSRINRLSPLKARPCFIIGLFNQPLQLALTRWNSLVMLSTWSTGKTSSLSNLFSSKLFWLHKFCLPLVINCCVFYKLFQLHPTFVSMLPVLWLLRVLRWLFGLLCLNENQWMVLKKNDLALRPKSFSSMK